LLFGVREIGTFQVLDRFVFVHLIERCHRRFDTDGIYG
jgi:hypothetical protein